MVKTYIDGKQVTADTENLAELVDVNAALLLELAELQDANAKLTTSNTELANVNTKLTTSNTELTAVNTKLTTSNTELTAVNTKLTTSNTELTSVNTNLTTQITKLTTSNTELSDVNANLVLQLADLATLIAKKLNQDDVPNLPLPYNYTALETSFINLADGAVYLTIDFQDAGGSGDTNWGAGLNFYPKSLTLRFFSIDTSIAVFFDNLLEIKLFNATSATRETLFAKIFTAKDIDFIALPTAVNLSNSGFDDGVFTPWVNEGSGIIVSSPRYSGTHAYYNNDTLTTWSLTQADLYLYSNLITQISLYSTTGTIGPSRTLFCEVTYEDATTTTLSTVYDPSSNAWFQYVLDTSSLTHGKFVTKIKLWISGNTTILGIDQIEITGSFIGGFLHLVIPLESSQILDTEILRLQLLNQLGGSIDEGTISLLGLAK